MSPSPPSPTLAPPPAVVPCDVRPEPQTPRPEPPRYLLAITQPGVPGAQYIMAGQLQGRPMFCLDRYRAHSWEHPDAILEWLRSLPEVVINGYRGRSLFAVKVRIVSEAIVGSWHVADAGREGGAA